MKTLIVYYSRTGKTENIVKKIKNELNCDIEKIDDGKNRSGVIQYIKSAFEANTGKIININQLAKNPKDYDLIIIGTPIWASTMSSPVLGFLDKYNDDLNNIAIVITTGRSGIENTIEKIEEKTNLKSIANLTLKRSDLNNNYDDKIKDFIGKVL